MTKEVEVKVVKQKRVRRGRGGLHKKEREQQEDEDEEEDPDTVTVSSREWEKMEEMKNTVKFYRSVKSIFEVDTMRAGAVATALQSKPG